MDKQRDWSTNYRKGTEKRLLNHVYHAIGDKPIVEIDHDDLEKIINLLDLKKLKSSTIAKTHNTIASILDFAIALRLLNVNLARDIKPLLPKGDEVTHHPAITIQQLPDFFEKLHKSKCRYETIVAIWLLMWTASRPHQIFKAKWAEIDFKNKEFVFLKARMKKRKIHISPLPNQAITALKELHGLTGHTEYLFPSQNSSKRHMHENTLKNAIQNLGFDATAHGMRTLFSTWANSQLGAGGMKYSIDAIENQIAHKEKDMTREAYNRCHNMPERIVMAQDWADILDKLKS